jgi:hypothetical protein
MKAFLVYITFFIGIVFTLTPEGPIWSPFLFSPRQVHVETYVYYLWEHAVKIVLLHVIHVESVKHRRFFAFMFWFQVFDTLDYMATYNEVWVYVWGVPTSANTVGFLLGALFLLHDYKNHDL